MYFWKYWRDTRRGVYVYLGILAWVTLFWIYGLHHANRLHNIGGDPKILWLMMIGITFSFAYLCAVVMGFATGASNVGGEFAKGTAEFLLTRPRSRRYFVWAGWSAGMVEVFALMVVTALIVISTTAFVVGPVWRQLPSPAQFQMDDQSIVVWKMVLAPVLMAAVIFGLTFFMSVLLKSGQRGVIASLGIIVGYQGLNAIMRIWTNFSLPSMDFLQHPNATDAAHLSQPLEIVGWALLALAFPFAAQLALDRKEI